MRFCVLILAALASACATTQTSMPTLDALRAAAADGSSVLVVNTVGDMNCDQTILGIHRHGEDHNEVVWTLRHAGYATSQPAILIVQPGRISISGGSCFRGGYYPSEMPALRYWFGSIEVAAGETIYIGTLQTTLTPVEARMTSGEQFWDSFFLGGDTTTARYPAYRMLDMSADVLERLRYSHPELAQRMVFRGLPQRIQPDDFIKAVRRAYAPGADGVAPTRDEARARLGAELTALGEGQRGDTPSGQEPIQEPSASVAQ